MNGDVENTMRSHPDEKSLTGVITLAEKAGEAIMSIYSREDFGTTYKEDASPLTHADLSSHEIILEGLSLLTPGLPVLSEEPGTAAYEVRQS